MTEYKWKGVEECRDCEGVYGQKIVCGGSIKN